MAISSILSSYGYANSGASARIEAQAAAAAAKLAAGKDGTVASGTTAKTVVPSSDVVLSDAAKAAAASKADNAKNPAALSKEVRAVLDKQYAGGASKGSPDLSGMSGRALATIALDKTGAFSAAEVSTAKNKLREQTRSEFSKAMSSGGGIAGLAAYSKQMVSNYDSMSGEERQARGWTDKFRASNATFVGTASMPNLFDHLD